MRRSTLLAVFPLACSIAQLMAEDLELRRFATHSRLFLGTEENLSASLRIGDLDGDGDPDVVVANGRHWPQQNYVFFNQRKGRFNLARPLGRDLATSYATELADLDNDGDLDIAVGNDTAPNAIFLNEGDGHFKHHGSFGDPSSIRSLTLADLDHARGRPNRLFLNDGEARFAEAITFGNQKDSTIDVEVADLNHDKLPDLVLANRDSQQNVVLINQGQLKFERKPFGSGHDETRAVAIADLDNDGHLDWVAGNIGQANIVYLNDGTGGIRESHAFGNEDAETYSLAVADMNNDGSTDIVVGNVSKPNAVYFNKGNGRDFRSVYFGEATDGTYHLTTGDLNLDGYLDIAVANSGRKNKIYQNLPPKK